MSSWGLLLIMLVSVNAFAFDWKDLWLTADQQGMELLENGKSEQAFDQFKSPGWQGVGAYRAGKYAEAVESFKKDTDSVNSQYNLGNAQARSGDFEGALATYDALLEKDIIDSTLIDDTQFNRKLVEQLLQQKKEQQSKGSESSDSNQSEDGKSSEDHQQSESNQSEQNESEQGQSSEEQDGESQDTESSKNEEQKQSALKKQTNDNDQSESESQKQEQLEASDKMEEPLSEDQQAIEQWLRRIPDDPSGLLRRKLIQSHKNEFPEVGNGSKPW